MAVNREKLVEKCLQCEEDKMLEVRKDARLCHEIMGLLSETYHWNGRRHKPHFTVVDYVRVLIEAEKDQRRLCHMIRQDAERRATEVDNLIASLRFMCEVVSNGESGVHVGGKAIQVDLSQILKAIARRVEILVTSDRGLLQGRQPQNQKDHMAHLWDAPASPKE